MVGLASWQRNCKGLPHVQTGLLGAGVARQGGPRARLAVGGVAAMQLASRRNQGGALWAAWGVGARGLDCCLPACVRGRAGSWARMPSGRKRGSAGGGAEATWRARAAWCGVVRRGAGRGARRFQNAARGVRARGRWMCWTVPGTCCVRLIAAGRARVAASSELGRPGPLRRRSPRPVQAPRTRGRALSSMQLGGGDTDTAVQTDHPTHSDTNQGCGLRRRASARRVQLRGPARGSMTSLRKSSRCCCCCCCC